MHGASRDRYHNVRIGMNGRLDMIQAAILLQKLAIFEHEIAARQHIAARYTKALESLVETPAVIEGAMSVWAQYTIRLDGRDGVAERLRTAGIPTTVYYALPLNRQPAYRDYSSVPGGTPVADRLTFSSRCQ